jgi:hypothetical protein
VLINRTPRKIFGSKRYEVTGEWRRLYKEELYVTYSSSNTIRGDQIKRKEMDAACSIYGDEKRCIQGLCFGNMRKRDHLENLGANGKIILKVSSRNGMKRVLDLCGSDQGHVLGSREGGSELSGSIKHGEFIG